MSLLYYLKSHDMSTATGGAWAWDASVKKTKRAKKDPRDTREEERAKRRKEEEFLILLLEGLDD